MFNFYKKKINHLTPLFWNNNIELKCRYRSKIKLSSLQNGLNLSSFATDKLIKSKPLIKQGLKLCMSKSNIKNIHSYLTNKLPLTSINSKKKNKILNFKNIISCKLNKASYSLYTITVSGHKITHNWVKLGKSSSLNINSRTDATYTFRNTIFYVKFIK